MTPPEGFEPFRSSPFSTHIGPLYVAWAGGLPILGLTVEEHHTNTMARLHGGMLASLADVAIGQAVKTALPAGSAVVTADMHVRYLGSASVGDWIEARSVLDRLGRSLIFATSSISTRSAVVATVAATLAVRHRQES